VSDHERALLRTAAERDDLARQVAALTAERDRLREHILDIDAHATPYGDIPEEPGFVGTYLVTAGALHRALGKIGHTAPSCEAELQRDYLLAERESHTTAVNAAHEGAKKLIAERDALAARLAALPWVRSVSNPYGGDVRRILAAVDALDGTAGPGEEGSDA
jgi:hypothetical protein